MRQCRLGLVNYFKMKTLVIALLCLSMLNSVLCAMTEAQLKSAAKLLRNVCQPKSKISATQIDNLHKGEFVQEPEIMSYMECILRTGQIMKDAKLNFESLKTQLANLPPAKAELSRVTAENCKDAAKSTDKFIAAYEFYKCFYEDNPENFFLP